MTNIDPGMPPTASSYNAGNTGVSEEFLPPAQYSPGVGRIEAGLFGERPKERIPGIVDEKNNVRSFYRLDTEPEEILGSMNDVNRKRLINIMYTRGWYGKSKPGGGFADSDRAAMRDLLYYSNLQGLSYSRVLNQIAQAPTIPGGGLGSPKPQVTNTQDLVEVANRTALATMGRKLSPDESRKFAQLYQQSQRADAAGSPQQAASADVFFQNRITQQYGAETDAYKYMTALSKVSNLLENL